MQMSTESNAEQNLVANADKIINKVIQLSVPEVDMDQYNSKQMKISANDFAVKKASEFVEQQADQTGKQATETGSSSNIVSGDKSGSTSSFNISPKTSGGPPREK